MTRRLLRRLALRQIMLILAAGVTLVLTASQLIVPYFRSLIRAGASSLRVPIDHATLTLLLILTVLLAGRLLLAVTRDRRRRKPTLVLENLRSDMTEHEPARGARG